MSLKLCSVSKKILTKNTKKQNKWINILKMDKNKCPKWKSTENVLQKKRVFDFFTIMQLFSCEHQKLPYQHKKIYNLDIIYLS